MAVRIRWQPQIRLLYTAPHRQGGGRAKGANLTTHLSQSAHQGKSNCATHFLCCKLRCVAHPLASPPPPSSSVVRLPFHEFAANNGCAAKVTFSCHDARHRTSEHQAKQGIHGAVRVAVMPARAVAGGRSLIGRSRLSCNRFRRRETTKYHHIPDGVRTMQKQQPNKNTLFTCGEVRDIYLADGPCKRFSPRIALSKELPRVIAMIVITPSGQVGPSTLNQ